MDWKQLGKAAKRAAASIEDAARKAAPHIEEAAAKAAAHIEEAAAKAKPHLEDAARKHGWELRQHPSTRRTATIGGFVAGGSTGHGAMLHGGLSEDGAVKGGEVRVLRDDEGVVRAGKFTLARDWTPCAVGDLPAHLRGDAGGGGPREGCAPVDGRHLGAPRGRSLRRPRRHDDALGVQPAPRGLREHLVPGLRAGRRARVAGRSRVVTS